MDGQPAHPGSRTNNTLNHVRSVQSVGLLRPGSPIQAHDGDQSARGPRHGLGHESFQTQKTIFIAIGILLSGGYLAATG